MRFQALNGSKPQSTYPEIIDRLEDRLSRSLAHLREVFQGMMLNFDIYKATASHGFVSDYDSPSLRR